MGDIVIGIMFILLGLFAGLMGIEEETGVGARVVSACIGLIAVGVGVLGVLTGAGVVS